jgi:hypothetical protein
MTTDQMPQWTVAKRRRLIAGRLVRGLALVGAFTALYFALPLDRLDDTPLWLILTIGVVTLAVVTAYQVVAILRATYPALRAVEALTIIGPLFLYLFAAVYYTMSRADPATFNLSGLTRTDTLYFTITTFATVGYGDIVATSQSARVLVMVQMILDLIVLGAVVRIFVGAVQSARRDTAPERPNPS